jgi:type I restriction enzyme, R subunit
VRGALDPAYLLDYLRYFVLFEDDGGLVKKIAGYHQYHAVRAATRYQNRSIETAQVMEELVEMARKFKEASNRGEELGLTEDEVRFYDALATNESAVKELKDETLKKIAHELTENLRQNITVDWSRRDSVRASLRLMVKRILRKYKYPPDQADAAVELVLQQAEAMGEAWETA